MANRPTRFFAPVSVGYSNSGAAAMNADQRSPGDPGGWTQMYVLGVHTATQPGGLNIGAAGAMTGDSQALRARGENRNGAMTGSLRGAQIQAANYVASASGTMSAAYIEAMAKGVNLGTLRGLEVISDNTEGTGTITTMVGARIRVIGAGTVTNGPWGLQIVNDSESALASAQPVDAFIRCESAVATTVCGSVIDVTSARINNSTGQYSVSLTANDNVICYYKDKDGTAHALVCSDADTVAIR